MGSEMCIRDSYEIDPSKGKLGKKNVFVASFRPEIPPLRHVFRYYHIFWERGFVFAFFLCCTPDVIVVFSFFRAGALLGRGVNPPPKIIVGRLTLPLYRSSDKKQKYWPRCGTLVPQQVHLFLQIESGDTPRWGRMASPRSRGSATNIISRVPPRRQRMALNDYSDTEAVRSRG